MHAPDILDTDNHLAVPLVSARTASPRHVKGNATGSVNYASLNERRLLSFGKINYEAVPVTGYQKGNERGSLSFVARAHKVP